MPKKISINIFDPESWKQAQKELKDLSEWIDERTELLVKLLASDGVEVADAQFKEAIYAGVNDVKVTSEITKTDAGYKASIFARGEAVGFIEFGTGINFDFPFSDMPDYETTIPMHGTYGNLQGSNPNGWWYRGEKTGNLPEGTEVAKSIKYDKETGNVSVKDRPGWMHTYGGPANSAMHNAYIEVQKKIEERVKEAFKYDR